MIIVIVKPSTSSFEAVVYWCSIVYIGTPRVLHLIINAFIIIKKHKHFIRIFVQYFKTFLLSSTCQKLKISFFKPLILHGYMKSEWHGWKFIDHHLYQSLDETIANHLHVNLRRCENEDGKKIPTEAKNWDKRNQDALPRKIMFWSFEGLITIIFDTILMENKWLITQKAKP